MSRKIQLAVSSVRQINEIKLAGPGHAVATVVVICVADKLIRGLHILKRDSVIAEEVQGNAAVVPATISRTPIFAD